MSGGVNRCDWHWYHLARGQGRDLVVEGQAGVSLPQQQSLVRQPYRDGDARSHTRALIGT